MKEYKSYCDSEDIKTDYSKILLKLDNYKKITRFEENIKNISRKFEILWNEIGNSKISIKKVNTLSTILLT